MLERHLHPHTRVDFENPSMVPHLPLHTQWQRLGADSGIEDTRSRALKAPIAGLFDFSANFSHASNM